MWAAHKERAAKEPSADGGSVDSRGLFSGGHLQGQALILIIRDALGTLRRAQSISIALANFTSLDRFLLVGVDGLPRSIGGYKCTVAAVIFGDGSEQRGRGQGAERVSIQTGDFNQERGLGEA